MLIRLALWMTVVLAGCGFNNNDSEQAQAPLQAPESGVVADDPSVAQAPPAAAVICTECHGVAAPSPFSDMATIQGLPVDAIENALYDFRAGTRPCRMSRCSVQRLCPEMDMCEVTAGLDADTIATLAAWYAALPFASAVQSSNPDLAMRGRQIHDAQCESCHINGGMAAIDQANRLRGQHKEYLRMALHQYRSGQRLAVGMMDKNVKALTEAEIHALVEFYASPIN